MRLRAHALLRGGHENRTRLCRGKSPLRHLDANPPRSCPPRAGTCFGFIGLPRSLSIFFVGGERWSRTTCQRPLGYNQLGLPLPRTLPVRVGSFGASIACSFGHERHRTHLSRQPHDLGGRASGVQSAVTFSNRWAWNEEGPLSSREAGLVALAGEPENRFLRACLRIATRESGGCGRGRDVESEIRLLLPLDAPTAHRTRHHRQGFRPPLRHRLMG